MKTDLADGGQAAGHRFVLEERSRYASSLIWDLQRRYFEGMGVDAWRLGEVPHYVTSNPTIARTYAEMVLAFRRDRIALTGDSASPLHICELGAGSGRFAFHFLRNLTQLGAEAGIAPSCFRYILTDVAEPNLDFLEQHPSLEPFVATGMLDFAAFDVGGSDRLVLRRSGTIAAGDLDQPLIAIANYVFDGVPHDLYFVHEQRLHDCLVTLSVDQDPANLDAAAAFRRLDCRFDYQPLAGMPYADPLLNDLLDDYRRQLTESHVLFPAGGLGCLARLAALSRQGLMLLSADKGEHRLGRLDGVPPPSPVLHGSFSLTVNYHAFAAWCEKAGGIALVPPHPHRSIAVLALLMTADAGDCRESMRCYDRLVGGFGPDDFYTVTRQAREQFGGMTVQEILSHLRLARFDSHLLLHALPRLVELAPDLDADMAVQVRQAADRAWEGYFPLGEAEDLANRIAALLYALDDYDGALVYYDRSIAIYGEDTGTLFNMALCHHMCGRYDAARPLLEVVVAHDATNAEAAALLADATS